MLRVLAEGPSYGYAIASALSDAGFGDIKGGTLYPLLGRLEASGFVTTEWRAGDGGPGRKFFELTDAGARRADELARGWRAFADMTTAFITTPGDSHE